MAVRTSRMAEYSRQNTVIPFPSSKIRWSVQKQSSHSYKFRETCFAKKLSPAPEFDWMCVYVLNAVDPSTHDSTNLKFHVWWCLSLILVRNWMRRNIISLTSHFKIPYQDCSVDADNISAELGGARLSTMGMATWIENRPPSTNSCILISAMEFHFSSRLFLNLPCQISSSPRPRNDHCPVLKCSANIATHFALSTLVLIILFSYFQYHSYIDMKRILSWNWDVCCPSSSNILLMDSKISSVGLPT